MKKRVHVLYSGNVQGVGFRFTAVRVADTCGITGWVRNLRDGKVEVVAEGEEARLIGFLEKIKTGPLSYYVRNIDLNWQQYNGEFKKFDIEF